ncbi:MAG: hypothetical protein IKW53_06690 [Clostridia bacterium]|nr:hypothetical protein [Clostridia bacterium]
MAGLVISFAVGVICIILGILNTRGNISSLHSYHRNRVKEEDVLPFGKLVGLGTIIIGAAVIIYSILSWISVMMSTNILAIVGMILMFIGMAVGIGISFYAMKKYNGGIM